MGSSPALSDSAGFNAELYASGGATEVFGAL